MSPFEIFEVVQQIIQVINWIIRGVCHVLQVLATPCILKPQRLRYYYGVID